MTPEQVEACVSPLERDPAASFCQGILGALALRGVSPPRTVYARVIWTTSWLFEWRAFRLRIAYEYAVWRATAYRWGAMPGTLNGEEPLPTAMLEQAVQNVLFMLSEGRE